MKPTNPTQLTVRLAAVAALLGALGAAPLLRGGEVIDRVLVEVNARAVTRSALDQRLRQNARKAGEAAATEPLPEMKKAAMEELVSEALLEDRALELGLVATDSDVEGFIRKLREENKVATEEEFVKALAATGLTPASLREQLHRSLSVQRVLGHEIYGRLDLGEDALRRAYERDKDAWRVPEQIRISEILVPRGEGKTGETRVLELARQLRAGARFEELVPRYSSGASRDRGGDLGFVARGELNPEIEKVVFSLLVGEVSDPIATKFGWHVVKVTDKVPSRTKPFAEVRGEVLQKARDDQFPKKLAGYLDRLRRDALIRVSDEAKAYYSAPAPAAPAPIPMRPTENAPAVPGKPPAP